MAHLPGSSSDHSPITLRLWGPTVSLPRQFKFEELWLSDHSCFTTVVLAWHRRFFGSLVVVLAFKLWATKLALKCWNQVYFGHIQTAIRAVSSQLDLVPVSFPSLSALQLSASLKVSLDSLQKKEETLWRQKSRVQWLASPYLNTKFFHASTVIRRCRN